MLLKRAWLVYTTRYKQGATAMISEYSIKGIELLKRAWLVRPDINRVRPFFKWNDEGIARVIPRKNNGHPVFMSGRINQASFKNNTFILILKHFQK